MAMFGCQGTTCRYAPPLLVFCASLALLATGARTENGWDGCEGYTGARPDCLASSSRLLAQLQQSQQQVLQDAGVTEFPYAYGLTVTPCETFSSQRARIFPFACGLTAAAANEGLLAKSFPDELPGAYNLITRDRGELFVLGGISQLTTSSSTVIPYIAKLETNSMKELWRVNLVDSPLAWQMSGSLSLATDGSLLAVFGRYIVRLVDRGLMSAKPLANVTVFNATTGSGAVQVQVGALPISEGSNADSTAYNGFVIMADGKVVTKSLHRKLDCKLGGLYALMNLTGVPTDPSCGGPGANSTVALVDGRTLEVLQALPVHGFISGRPTSGMHRGKEYVYMVTKDGLLSRYQYAEGQLSLDTTWTGSAYTPPDGALTGGCTAVVPLGGWLIVGDSASPAPTPYTLTAIWQDDPGIAFYLTPFKELKDMVPQGIAKSWVPVSVSVDPTTNLVYMADFMVGGIAAYRLTAGGFVRQWVLRQWTTDFLSLLGPAGQRVLVASNATEVDAPPTVANAVFNTYTKSVLIFRNATTGETIAQSSEMGLSIVLPHTPGFDGDYFHLSMLPNSTLTKISYNPGQCRSEPNGSG